MAKRYHESSYEKKMMKKAGGMINDDRSAQANLPRNVIQKNFGMPGYGMPREYIDDLYKGVEKQMQEDTMGFKKVFKPSKY
jgi:hypothetical protein